MHHFRFVLLVAVAALGVALAAPAGAGEAVQQKFDSRLDVATTVIDACGIGEVVLLQGTFHIRGHFTSDASGGAHITQHTELEDVTAIGETTGAAYGYSSVDMTMVQFRSGHDGFRQTGTVVNRATLTGPSGAYRFTWIAHVTLNADGEVTAMHDETRVLCTDGD